MVGGHIQTVEENQVNLKVVWDGDGRIVAPPTHGVSPQDRHSTYSWGGHLCKGNRDIRSVLPTGVEFSGLSGGRVPGEGT